METPQPQEKPRRQLFTTRNFVIAFIVALLLGLPATLCMTSLIFRLQCSFAGEADAESAVRSHYGTQPVEIESTQCLPPSVNYGFNFNRRTEPAFCIITNEPRETSQTRGQTTHFFVERNFSFADYDVDPVFSSSAWEELGCDDW